MVANLKACVLVTDGGRVLLIKEWSKRKNVFAWNMIKGTMDKENESVFECALREAMEEANVEVKLDKSLGVHVNYFGEDKRTIYFIFTAKIVGGSPVVADKSEQKARKEDIVELKWFSLDELFRLNKEDFVAGVSYRAIQKLKNKEFVPLSTISTEDYTV